MVIVGGHGKESSTTCASCHSHIITPHVREDIENIMAIRRVKKKIISI